MNQDQTNRPRNNTQVNRHLNFQQDKNESRILYSNPFHIEPPPHRSSIVYGPRDQNQALSRHNSDQWTQNILNENNKLKSLVPSLEYEIRELKQYVQRLRDGSEIRNLQRILWTYEEEKKGLIASKDQIINDFSMKLHLQIQKNRNLQSRCSALVNDNLIMKQQLRRRN